MTVLLQASPTLPGAVERRAGRASRYALRHALWSLSSLPSVAACARSLIEAAAGATVSLGADGRAGWSGLNTCSSVAACPCCSARIREQRTREIDAAGVAQVRRGGSLGFATFTMAHGVSDSLAALLDVERAAWKAVQQDKAFRALRQAWGIRYVRSWEVTETPGELGGHGWHPHLHVLWFVDAPLSTPVLSRRVGEGVWRTVTLGDLLSSCTERAWATSVRKATGKTPTRMLLQEVKGTADDSVRHLTRYLTKVQDSYGKAWGVGREMASGPSKNGKHKRSRTPFDILERAAGLSRDKAGRRLPGQLELALWLEYETATKGLRVIEASRGLLRELGVEELVEELAPDGGPEALPVLAVDADDYRRVVRFRAGAVVLDAVERHGAPGGLDVLRRLRLRAQTEPDQPAA